MRALRGALLSAVHSMTSAVMPVLYSLHCTLALVLDCCFQAADQDSYSSLFWVAVLPEIPCLARAKGV
jgi:hypothetical protein